MTYSELEKRVIESIQSLYGQTEARSIQRFLFSCYADIDPARYLLLRMEEAEPTFEKNVLEAIPILAEFVPVQYVTGKTWFCGHEFFVTPDVLIPRPETEELVTMIIKKISHQKDLRILDIGTGSGAIAISLAISLPIAQISAIDISNIALEVSEKNAFSNKANVKFIQADILDENCWPGFSSYNLIVSNPPYVKQSERVTMKRNVLDYEPGLALFVEDSDPLLFYRRISEFAMKHLEVKGELWFEINETEAENINKMLIVLGFSNIQVYKDINSKNRFVCATY